MATTLPDAGYLQLKMEGTIIPTHTCMSTDAVKVGSCHREVPSKEPEQGVSSSTVTNAILQRAGPESGRKPSAPSLAQLILPARVHLGSSSTRYQVRRYGYSKTNKKGSCCDCIHLNAFPKARQAGISSFQHPQHELLDRRQSMTGRLRSERNAPGRNESSATT